MKLVLIDSPIRCPYYKENTCFVVRSKRKKSGMTISRFRECNWHQGMPADMFPKNCPLPDYIDPGFNTTINPAMMKSIQKIFKSRIAAILK